MDDESVKAFYESAGLILKSFEKLLFELQYVGKLSKADMDKMSYFELLRWYDMLVERKEAEFKKSQDMAQP